MYEISKDITLCQLVPEQTANGELVASESGTGVLARYEQLGRELFIDTFGHLYDPADLEAFLQKVFSPPSVARELATGKQLWIALTQERWIGFCKLGPLSLPIDPGPGLALELKQLYVQREFHGTGVADALMQLFLNWAKAQAAQHLYISCWSENHRALAFYRRYGFQTVASYQFWVGNHADDERILYRAGSARDSTSPA